MIATVPASSRDLRPDGRGRYLEGNDTVRSYANIAYMFFTYWPETCEEPLPQQVRWLEFSLNRPVSPARSLGVIRERESMVTAFNSRGKTFIEMEVGSTVAAPVVILRFRENGAIHFLRFGNESLGATAPLNPVLRSLGEATTHVQITRTAKTEWDLLTTPSSIARLSRWTPGNRERSQPDHFDDLGLYEFSFELKLNLQRPHNDRLVNGEFVRQPVAK